jgi:hypothetical protein
MDTEKRLTPFLNARLLVKNATTVVDPSRNIRSRLKIKSRKSYKPALPAIRS